MEGDERVESWSRAVVVLVLAMLLAGCGGSDGSGDQTTPTATTGAAGGEGDDNETEEPAPEPQEVLNETLDYARAPEQSGDSTNFDVPPDSMGLQVTYQGQHDCPTDTLGYQQDAEIVLVDPNGEETRELLFGAGAGGSGSGSVDCNNPPTPSAINANAVAGTWEVRTEGVYTGMVHVTAVVNPSGSA